MKKRRILFLSILVLMAFISCKTNVDDSNTGDDDTSKPDDTTEETDTTPPSQPELPPAPCYFDVAALEDGFHISLQNVPEGLTKKTFTVYNLSTKEFNLTLFIDDSTSINSEIIYPFVNAGTEYEISFSLNNAQWNNYKDGGSKKIVATGGLGNYSVSADGVIYDGNNTLSLSNYKVTKPENLQNVNPYGYGHLYTTPETVVWQNHKPYYQSFNTYNKKNMDISEGTATITSEEILADLQGANPNFWIRLEYGVNYNSIYFYYQIQTNILFTYSKPGAVYPLPDSWLSLSTTSNGFSCIKKWNTDYPNVRINVYNETKKHSCPTVILDKQYKEFNYDYLNDGDLYTVQLMLWDSNWKKYLSYSLKNITSLGGHGDFYFTSSGYTYDQGSNPEERIANILFTDAEISGQPRYVDIAVNGNLYITDGSKTTSSWNNFPYTYDASKKTMTINISSELKKFRGKVFYAEMGTKWKYNNIDYELSFINNYENKFTDTHVKGATNITEPYTVLPEYGTVKIDPSLQGKTAYLIKYNKSDKVIKDKTTSSSAGNRNIGADTDTENSSIYHKPFEPIDPGERLGPVTKNERSISSRAVNTYSIGDTKQFYVYTTKEKKEPVSATFQAEGERCYVWYCNNNSQADSVLQKTIKENKTSFKTVADKFDAIYDMETSIIGRKKMDYNYTNIITTSEDDKVVILIYDIYTDYNKNQNGGIIGYFHGADYYKKENTPNSNECEMIYIDSAFLGNNPTTVYSTLVHEFQHLLCSINKGWNKGIGTSSWFTEMMSVGTENVLENKCLGLTESNNVRGRATLFNAGYNFGFENWDDEKNIYNYSNATLFADYLMKNYGGAKLWQEIAQNNYGDENAVTKALQKLGYSETYDSVMMKMGQMIINSYDANSETSDFTINKDVTSEIIDKNGDKQSITINKFDLKKSLCHENMSYSYNDRVKFSNCNSKNGPSILKGTSGFGEIHTKAIAVYQLTTDCGSTMEFKDPGADIEMAIYFK